MNKFLIGMVRRTRGRDTGGGNDSIFGGIGDDTIFGSSGNCLISGNGGNDYIDGESGNDSCWAIAA